MNNLIKAILMVLIVPVVVHADPKLHQKARQIAKQHKLDPDLFVSIVQTESSFRIEAFNATTHDYGLTQINIKTAKAFGLDIGRLKRDPEYALQSGALILADFKKRYQTKDGPLWVCRYNVGSGPLVGLKMVRCKKYLAKVRGAALDFSLGGGIKNGH